MSLYKLFAIIGLLTMFSGCATTTPDNPDPYESFNRSVYSFNNAIDSAVLKPVAQGYQYITPNPIQQGITNFFSNIADIPTVLNDLLQGKFSQAMHDTGRVLLNSTVGLGGLFDVASISGLQKHDEDFGQTLGVWGFKPGPYLVLPFFGSSDIRDGIGLAGDLVASPLIAVQGDQQTYWGLTGLSLINTRANLLEAEKLLNAASLDEYSYLRNAYLQNRRNLVYDGHPPKTQQQQDDDALLFGDDSE